MRWVTASAGRLATHMTQYKVAPCTSMLTGRARRRPAHCTQMGGLLHMDPGTASTVPASTREWSYFDSTGNTEIGCSQTVRVSTTTRPWPIKPNRDSPEWGRFARDFWNQEIELMDLAVIISCQHAICSWLKRPFTATDNFLCSQVLGVDFDDETPESDIELVKKIRIVRQCGTVIYTTVSHRPEAPRCRVLFVVDKPIVDPETHRRYARGLVNLMGGDKATVNPTRTYHGAGGVDGRTEFLGNVLDTATVEGLAEEYEITQSARTFRDFSGDPPDVQEVADLLRRIDPARIDYETWWRCIAAVHSVFPDQTGIDLVKNWTHHRPGEIEQKFRSFGDGTRISVGTLYHKVREYEQEVRRHGDSWSSRRPQ